MTLNQIRKLLRDAGVEFFVKKEKGIIAKIHVIVEESDASYK